MRRTHVQMKRSVELLHDPVLKLTKGRVYPVTEVGEREAANLVANEAAEWTEAAASAGPEGSEK